MNRINIIKNAFEKGNQFHKKMYPLFKIFINFLESEGFKYYLCGGSLLGCIRNNNRIGWDDDFDIYIDTKEIRKFNKFNYSDDNIKTDLNVFYRFDINNNKFVIILHSSKFWQVWIINESGKLVSKVTDIFNDKDVFYKKGIKPIGPPLKKKFNDMICNVSFNYKDELNYFYKNYKTEYVLCNHSINSCYWDRDRNNYIIMTANEYELYNKKFGINS